ncbi:MAG: TIR domain-containing protein [Pseudomonadota bacterium]
MADIFLSYSRDDQATARQVAEGLERAGFSVWWDVTLSAGEAYDKVTEKALEDARAVVVLWSRTSVDSRWVRAEATQAIRSGTLVPVMIEPCKRPIMFELTHTADLSHWKGDPADRAWQSFVIDLRRFVEKSGPVGTPQTTPTVVRRHNRTLAIAIAVVLLAAAGVAVWMSSRPPALPAVASALSTATAQANVTLAVLPFVNMSSDPEQEYFSDGLSEELLNQLAQIKDLRVAGRTSSFSFKGKNDDLRVIGEKLGVGHILEGSVRKAGKQLRITAQLINAVDGTHLWSQIYERELNDVFAIQEEIAVAVTQALSIKLGVGESTRLPGATANVIAYDKYLQGRSLWLGLTQLPKAVELFREAVSIDPQYARAWYALQDALAWAPDAAASPGERAAAAARVLALAPDAWWSRVVRADQLVQTREWFKAEAAARSALAVEPSSEFEAGTMLASILGSVGRRQEGVQYFERARQLEPMSLGISGILQSMYTGSDRLTEADAEYQRSKSLIGGRGTSEIFALLRLWQDPNSTPAAVEAQFRSVLSLDTPPNELNRALLGTLTNKAAALGVLRKAFQDPAIQSSVFLNTRLAWFADHFGDKELALAALRRVVLDLGGQPVVLWSRWETGVRADPRFKDLVRQAKIVDYWGASGNWGDFCKPLGSDDFECH